MQLEGLACLSALLCSGIAASAQVQAAFEPLFRANTDAAIINIGHDSLKSYELVIVPADYVMDPASAKAIRDHVQSGGADIMTAFSAKVDEHGQWFDSPLPGRLSDVFGLKTNAFYDADQPLTFEIDGRSISSGIHRYEVPEPSTATVLSGFSNTPDRTPAVTVNRFGKGTAIYLATESNASVIGLVLDHFYPSLGIEGGRRTPAGVFARVVDGRTLYVNTTAQDQSIRIEGSKKGITTDRDYNGLVILKPQGADLIPGSVQFLAGERTTRTQTGRKQVWLVHDQRDGPSHTPT